MKKLYSELPKINTYSFTYLFIRPNSSTTYVDAAYCYRSSSVVCRSVCLSDKLVSPAKTAKPIAMAFRLRTPVGPLNHVLDGGSDLSWERAILGGGRIVPL